MTASEQSIKKRRWRAETVKIGCYNLKWCNRTTSKDMQKAKGDVSAHQAFIIAPSQRLLKTKCPNRLLVPLPFPTESMFIWEKKLPPSTVWPRLLVLHHCKCYSVSLCHSGFIRFVFAFSDTISSAWRVWIRRARTLKIDFLSFVCCDRRCCPKLLWCVESR